MSAIRIACSADARYARHCAAMLASVLAREAPGTVHVHFLHGPRFPPRLAGGLRTMVERGGGRLHLHAIGDDAVRALPVSARWTPAIWYRILLPRLLPEHERVLYLDADVLAADSLAPLFALDLDGHHVGAVTNVPERHMLGHAASVGLPGPAAYFNSGVLLMNLELMRRDGTTEALRDHAAERGDALLWPDQDTLNAVLSATRLALHPRWNRMHSLDFPWAGELLGPDAVAEARRAPALLHFEGPAENKPWHLLASAESRRRYAGHRRDTPWPRHRPAGVTPANLVRRAARSLRP